MAGAGAEASVAGGRDLRREMAGRGGSARTARSCGSHGCLGVLLTRAAMGG